MNKNQNAVTHKLKEWVVAALFGVMASAASADVLYSQPTVDGAEAYFSNMGAGVQNVDGFQLSGAMKVTGFNWWGSYSIDSGDDFIVRLFSDTTGTLSSLLSEFTMTSVSKTDSGLMDSGQRKVSFYSFVLPTPMQLSSGQYYLSVMNEASQWNWSTDGANQSGDSESLYRAADGDPWEVDSVNDLAFEVLGSRQQQSVPEPGSVALVTLAGISLLLARRRFRPENI